MNHPAVVLFNDIVLHFLLALIVCGCLPIAIAILLVFWAIDAAGGNCADSVNPAVHS